MADKEYYLPGENPPASNRGGSTAPLPAVDWDSWSKLPAWKRNLVAALDAAPAVVGMGGDISAGILGMPLESLNAVLPGLGLASHAAFTVSGGGLGGATGQGIREGGYRLLGLGDAPGTIGGASREQATMSTVGQLAAPIIQTGARGLYEGMIKPGMKLLNSAPDVARTAWEMNVPIPKRGEPAAIRPQVTASAAQADAMVDAAGRPVTKQIPAQVTSVIPAQPAQYPPFGSTTVQIPPPIQDVAAHTRQQQGFTAALQQVAKRVGIDPAELATYVRKDRLDTGDLAMLFNRYGLKADELAVLKRIDPGPAPAAQTLQVLTPSPVIPARPAIPVGTPARTVTEPPTIPWSEITQERDALLRKYAGDDTGERAQGIKDYFDAIEQKWNPTGDPDRKLTYREVQDLKRGAQDTAKAQYKANDNRTANKPDTYYEAAQSVAANARKALDNGTPTARIPGLNDVNAQTRKLETVAQAVENTSKRSSNPVHAPMTTENLLGALTGLGGGLGVFHQFDNPLVGVGAGLAAATGSKLLMDSNRPALSRALLTMGKNPGMRFGYTQLPRAADWLLGYPMNPAQVPDSYGAFPADFGAQAQPKGNGDFYLPNEMNP